MEVKDRLFQITAPDFVAGLIARRGIIIKTAPKVWPFRSMAIGQAIKRCQVRGWKIKEVEDDH
jgi:hypothetical protein